MGLALALMGAPAAPGFAGDTRPGSGPAVLADAGALAAALQDDAAPLLIAGRTLDRSILAPLYRAHNYQPIWTEARYASLQIAIGEADSHGLDAAAYRVTAVQPVDRELLLTDAFLRYATALARGRVKPQELETDWRIATPAFDPGKALDAALSTDIATALQALAPHAPAYEALRVALQRYLGYARAPWRSVSLHVPLHPGDRDPNLPALRERLAAEGYLDPASPGTEPELYDPTVAAAVAHFQAAHGLAPDGALGRATLASLNVSAAQRVKQIRLDLERWRSLPRYAAPRRIEVNVAAATATLYEDDQPTKVMRAIVGAVAHPTPVLRARMVSVLLNPPWLVPSSIIENEIRPALKRDPKYLQRANLVYAEVNGGKTLMQLPGPKNSLGQLKFEMPNPDDIYLHDTPERRLFTQARRYYSHGCVRVEDPRELARMLLGSDQWSRESIDAAIATGDTENVPLGKTLPVYVLYWTAFVDPDGTVEFRDDIYGRDRRLGDALAAFSAAEHLASREDSRRG